MSPFAPDAMAGRSVLITGASSGIGKATAVKVADAGATVLLVARTLEKLEETRDEIIAAMAATGKELIINWPLRWYSSHITAKRLIDEGNGGMDEAPSDLGALHPGDWLAQAFGILPNASGLGIAGCQGERKQFRPHAFEIHQALVKAVIFRRWGIGHIALSAHVPFAKVAGGVAVLLELSGDNRSCGIKPLRKSAFLVHVPIVQIRANPPALWVLSRGDRHARWRTNRRIDIKVLKLDALGGQSIDVLGFDVFSAKAGKIGPAHVIDQDHNDIRFALGSFAFDSKGRRADQAENRAQKGDG